MPWQGHDYNQQPYTRGVYRMKFSETRHDLKTFGTAGEQFDQKKILGIAVAGSCVYLQSVDIPARISEKLSMTIPVMQLPAGVEITTIKSIQFKKRLTVAEIVGPMTTQVKNVINVIAAQLTAANMVTAFFPGSGGAIKASTNYYFGFDLDTLRAANPNIKNIRLLDNGQGLIFTQANQLKQLGLSQINNDWVREATVAYESKKEISFLGRVQENKVAITLSDETTFMATLTRTRASVTSLSDFRQKVSSVLGTIQHAGVSILTATKGQELILVRATAVNQ